MTKKHLRMTYVESGISAVAELQEKEAPRTTELIWRCFEKPAHATITHAIYCGREIVFPIPPSHQKFDPSELRKENQIILPTPGDLCFTYFAPFEVNSPGCNHSDDHGLFDFMIFYGRNARLFSSQGWLPVNLFGTIVENLEAFAGVCHDVRSQGVKEMRIERV